jgi:hypothetical protein
LLLGKKPKAFKLNIPSGNAMTLVAVFGFTLTVEKWENSPPEKKKYSLLLFPKYISSHPLSFCFIPASEVY